jgi:hypothetical protein
MKHERGRVIPDSEMVWNVFSAGSSGNQDQDEHERWIWGET